MTQEDPKDAEVGQAQPGRLVISQEDYERIIDPSKRDPQIEAARQRTLERVAGIREKRDETLASVQARLEKAEAALLKIQDWAVDEREKAWEYADKAKSDPTAPHRKSEALHHLVGWISRILKEQK